ncbi:phosphotransferase-like protein [Lacticaseibacillus sp. N501-2]|uniref:phosphotransferase-like protein n=1 Tax=Lacticaseibacillus salsurae TaxID=3367729 RepID=UPI0038B37711
MLQTFADLPLLLVGVTAPMAVIQQRRLATWGQIDCAMITQRWEQAVHLGHQYDLMVDTDQLTPKANAERILMAMGGVRCCESCLSLAERMTVKLSPVAHSSCQKQSPTNDLACKPHLKRE